MEQKNGQSVSAILRRKKRFFCPKPRAGTNALVDCLLKKELFLAASLRNMNSLILIINGQVQQTFLMIFILI